MEKIAVIQLAGHQYLVGVGDKITIDKHLAKKSLKVTDVLLLINDKGTQVGTPNVKDASVTLDVVEEKKADKVRVQRFRAKSRYRLTNGHRQPQTVLTVKSIA